MKHKKKIIFFLQSGVGGAERITATIGKSLDTNKFDIIFYLLDRPLGTSTIENFIPKEYNIKKLSNAKGWNLVKLLNGVLNTEKPDIVFSSMIYVNTKLLALKWLHKQTKFIIRNNNYLYTLTRSQKCILKMTYGWADYIIAQTEEMKEELIKDANLSKEKVVVLHNPIDIETIEEKIKEKSPYNEENTNIKYVASGRFFHVKGFDILVKAFKKVIEKQPNSELFIVGNKTGNCAEYYQKIELLINDLQLTDKVHCVGFQDNPYIYIKHADCFVLSSRNEGLPNVLIEALYLGTPSAATTCIPIIKRIVEDGKTGYLAESENPESLAKAMINASSLGRIKSTYKSATIKDFTNLFEL